MWARQNFTIQLILDNRRALRRMLKMAVQQGRSENEAGRLFQHPAKRKGICLGHEPPQRRHHQRSSG